MGSGESQTKPLGLSMKIDAVEKGRVPNVRKPRACKPGLATPVPPQFSPSPPSPLPHPNTRRRPPATFTTLLHARHSLFTASHSDPRVISRFKNNPAKHLGHILRDAQSQIRGSHWRYPRRRGCHASRCWIGPFRPFARWVVNQFCEQPTRLASAAVTRAVCAIPSPPRPPPPLGSTSSVTRAADRPQGCTLGTLFAMLRQKVTGDSSPLSLSGSSDAARSSIGILAC